MQQSNAHSMTLFAADALDETSHQGSPRCQAGCACLKNIPIESNKHTNRIIPAVALFKQDTLLPWQLQPLSLEAAPSTAALWLARLGLWAFHLLLRGSLSEAAGSWPVSSLEALKPWKPWKPMDPMDPMEPAPWNPPPSNRPAWDTESCSMGGLCIAQEKLPVGSLGNICRICPRSPSLERNAAL